MNEERESIRAPGGVRLHIAPGIERAWVLQVWEERVRAGAEHLTVVGLPAGWPTGEAVVKVYRPRKSHGLLWRLRSSRASREGRGYEEFARRGIPSLRFLFWGEERRWGLLHVGSVATVRIDAEPISVAWARSRDDGLLDAAVNALAAIHRAGLVHGDPRTRNFLATRPVPLAIDLPAWSLLNGSSQARDLVRFLGSSAALTGGMERARALLERYRAAGPGLPLIPERILEASRCYGIEKGEP